MSCSLCQLFPLCYPAQNHLLQTLFSVASASPQAGVCARARASSHAHTQIYMCSLGCRCDLDAIGHTPTQKTPHRSLAHPADLYLTDEQGKWYHLHRTESQLATQWARNERGGCFLLGICMRAEKAIRSAFASLSAAFQQASQTAGVYRCYTQDALSSSALASAPASFWLGWWA